MKVVIIDDSKAMRSIIKRHLKKTGLQDLELAEATNGAEGLQAVDELNPDLVLCDWNMPIMDGMAVLEELRARGNHVKFVFITTEGSALMRKRAKEAGALHLLSKPFTVDQFTSLVKMAAAA